jgi:Immunoglobulin-like domain of bacterial spore germination
MAHYFPLATVTFGEFAEGDSQSGEIEVLGGGEGGGPARLRSTLLLRQIDGGWHVIAAVNENVAITSPEAQAEIPGDEPLTVEGVGRGFEAAIAVRVETPDGSLLLADLGSGGSGETPEPFSVTIDLGDDDLTGQTLAVIAQGGTGLEDDPGEFSAVPVVVVA